MYSRGYLLIGLLQAEISLDFLVPYFPNVFRYEEAVTKSTIYGILTLRQLGYYIQLTKLHGGSYKHFIEKIANYPTIHIKSFTTNNTINLKRNIILL